MTEDLFKEPLDTSLEYARSLDAGDPFSLLREEFYLPEGVSGGVSNDTPGGALYMDGNSLGLLSRRAERSLLELLHSWRTLGIDGWTAGEHPWFNLSERLSGLVAPLVGARPEEVMVTGSTTANLHQLLATFYRPRAGTQKSSAGGRTKLLADELAFPSDIYALQSQLRLRGLDPEEHLSFVPSRDGRTLEEADIVYAMTEEVAVAVLPTVLYRSGQLLDGERISAAARERGVLLALDLSHSVGAVPHELSEWGVDLAFWCSYKYLNGGPGAVGGLYVNRRHFGTAPGLAGWFGSSKERQFDMEHEFSPAVGAGAYQVGTPHVLSLAPLLGSLELFDETGLGPLRERSLRLTEYLLRLADAELAGRGFEVGTPREGRRRGGHIALEHESAASICRALKARGVIPDFRRPNIVRLAPAPLYTSFTEVWQTVRELREVMRGGEYRGYENRRGDVS